MKVILLQDVAKIGRKHTVVNVPDGYGQNQLIPKGWAKLATPNNLKSIEHLQANKEATNSALEEKYFKAKARLSEEPVTVTAPKNPKGHLFAAIHHDKIVEAIRALGVEVEDNMVHLNKPLKEAGEHEAILAFGSHESSFIIKIE